MVHTTTSSREYTEGWKGRRRSYHCTECNEKFQVDTLNSLPVIDRVCRLCKLLTSIYVFVDKKGKEFLIRGPNFEHATLKAMGKNNTLKFKVPQEVTA